MSDELKECREDFEREHPSAAPFWNGETYEGTESNAWWHFKRGWRAAWSRRQQVPPGYRLQPISEFDAMQEIISRQQVPEGYAIVPVEPTPEMKMAGASSLYIMSRPEGEAEFIYRDMLAAAPKPEESK